MSHGVIRRIPLVAMALLMAAACGESTAPSSVPNSGGSPAAGAPGLAGNTTAGTAVSVGGAGSGGGGGGSPSGGNSAQSGGAGASGAGTGGAAGNAGVAGVSGTGGSGGAGAGACPPGAVVCDDFEKYTAGSSDLSPDWITYTYSGAVKVDATKPHAGKQSLHVTTQAGMRHYADIIRETRGKELLPRKHYGRLMVWISAIPPDSHWNINLSSGPLTGFPDEIGKFAEGGMFGKLMSNYAQRERAMANGQYLLRGGGPEAGDAAADADCAVAAPAQKIAASKWVCWEWEFDGVGNEAHLWLDGQAQSEIDAVQSGKQCQGPGFNGKPMTPTYVWEGPEVFDKLIVGWEQYQDTPGQEAWIDDLAVGAERIGCPQ